MSLLSESFLRRGCSLLLAGFTVLSLVVASSTDTLATDEPELDRGSLLLNEAELAQVLSHGPWPPVFKQDPSNKYSGNPEAIAFGKALFFNPALSADGKTSCASCHHPDESFAAGPMSATKPHELGRDTLSLVNVRFNRWFGWDGSTDNLWAQSIRPIINPTEMNFPASRLKSLIFGSPLKIDYTSLFGLPDSPEADKGKDSPVAERAASHSTENEAPEIAASHSDENNVPEIAALHLDEQVLVNIGKALAAYQETLLSGKTPFDTFRDAVAAEDWQQAQKYPQAAQRGLSLFLGKGRCAFCHSGALFTNGEFHDAGVPYFVRAGVVDTGRHGGIQALKNSRFTLAGKYNDDPGKSGAWAVNSVRQQHGNFGIFRVPGLRNVAKTAPYMHNGSLKTLEDVIRHYATINTERLHADGEAILKPLNLTEQEIGDLQAFLESLSD